MNISKHCPAPAVCEGRPGELPAGAAVVMNLAVRGVAAPEHLGLLPIGVHAAEAGGEVGRHRHQSGAFSHREAGHQLVDGSQEVKEHCLCVQLVICLCVVTLLSVYSLLVRVKSKQMF